MSVVSNGNLAGNTLTEVIGEFKSELLGKRVYENTGTDFPLLIKFIDANEDLSIQVHPDDPLAAKRHNSLGKTEMWYVLQADKGASLISGFNREVSQESYLEKFNKGNLMDILNREYVNDGDVFYIPAGRVHTIGKGLLIAEIQQTSDITYRIYDFDRVDDQGNKRELHVEEALEAIDYSFYDNYKTNYSKKIDEVVPLCSSEYFSTQKMKLTTQMTRNYKGLDSFIIYICTSGSCEIKTKNSNTSLSMGECILLPACFTDVEILPNGETELLETYIPQ